jgi:hypothetical protein
MNAGKGFGHSVATIAAQCGRSSPPHAKPLPSFMKIAVSRNALQCTPLSTGLPENKTEIDMRKALLIAAATVALSASAFAQSNDYNPAAPAEVGAGAVAGTAAGVAVSEGVIGGSLGAALPATVAGAAATGGVAGVGVAAGIDAAVQPCRGFAAVFGMNRQECAQRQAMSDRQQLGVQRRVIR